MPLVPLLTAALVAAAFLTVRDGAESDGDPAAAPSAVVTGDTGPATVPSAPAPRPSGAATPGPTGTPATGATGAARGGPPAPGATGSRSPRTGTSPSPSRTGATAPAKATPTGPAPSGGRTGGRPSERPVPFGALRVGDCFDIDRAAPGTAVRRSCDTPHSAELVARPRLTGHYATDRAVREAAAVLCREPLRSKAARQPLGTRWTTFVQYPYRTSYLLGSDTVACSLVAPSASGGRIGHRLR